VVDVAAAVEQDPDDLLLFVFSEKQREKKSGDEVNSWEECITRLAWIA